MTWIAQMLCSLLTSLELLRKSKSRKSSTLLCPHTFVAWNTFWILFPQLIRTRLPPQGASRKLYRSAMSKCAAVWNKAHYSSGTGDGIKDIASMRCVVPSVTRWSSEYHAIQKTTRLTEALLICWSLQPSEWGQTAPSRDVVSQSVQRCQLDQPSPGRKELLSWLLKFCCLKSNHGYTSRFTYSQLLSRPLTLGLEKYWPTMKLGWQHPPSQSLNCGGSLMEGGNPWEGKWSKKLVF